MVSDEQQARIIDLFANNDKASIDNGNIIIGGEILTTDDLMQALWVGAKWIDVLAETISDATDTLAEIYPEHYEDGYGLEEIIGSIQALNESDKEVRQ